MLAGALLAAGPASSLNPGHSLDTGSRSGIALHVVPFPGTPDATPVSQVIFSGVRAGDRRSGKGRGSRSGGHRGKLVALVH
jgi:hypothetical protein